MGPGPRFGNRCHSIYHYFQSPTGEFYTSCLHISTGLEVLVLKRGTLISYTTRIPWNYTSTHYCCHQGSLDSMCPETSRWEEEFPLLEAGVIYPNLQKGVELLSHNEGRRNPFRSGGRLGASWFSHVPCNLNRQMQQPSLRKAAQDVMTEYHRLGDLKTEINLLTVLEAGSPRSRCQQGYCLVGPLFLACRQWPSHSLSSVSTGELKKRRNSLVVQWLGLHTFTAEGPGLIPSRGTKIPQATRYGHTTTPTKKKRLSLVSLALLIKTPVLSY